MFEELFTYPAVIRRHREGPLAAERAEYLRDLAAQGMARGTLLIRSSYCLCVAVEVDRWPADHCFDEDEIQVLSSAWAEGRANEGWACRPVWPYKHIRRVATQFLGWLGRLHFSPAPEPSGHETKIADFLTVQREGRWQSARTCDSARWQIEKFLKCLDHRGVGLQEVLPEDIDAYFKQMAQSWGRSSLRTSAKMLRAWFTHCERRGWTRSGLARAILLPRIYRHEDLPLGPTWEEVGRMLTDTAGDDPASLRDHAILLLLSVYGLRSGEVRRLSLEDVNWRDDRLRIVRSKSGREDSLIMEPKVGNALARYLREGRPKSDSRIVFLTLTAPHRPLSTGGLYDVVKRHLSKPSSLRKGRGPHALRHACARHLLASGHSLKEVGDHLGHRSQDSTQIYAKVDIKSLRKVAFDDLGGLL